MASKSNLLTTVDTGAGTITIQDDASGFLIFKMSDGVNSVTLKVGSTDSDSILRVISASKTLRTIVPQS